MAEQDLRKWTTFFKDAGIPIGPSVEYAGLFCDHRIKDNLLGDLTKDILNDIGIAVMGDIMSILKHAKAIYAKLEREKSSNRLVNNLKAQAVVEEDPKIYPGPQIKKKKVLQKIVSKPKVTVLKQAGDVPTSASKVLNVGNLKTVSDDRLPTVAKKRPIKNTLTLSERFADEGTVPPKVYRESTEFTTNNLNLKTKKPLVKIKSLPKPVDSQITSGSKVGVKSPVKRKSAFERLGNETSVAEKKAEIATSKIQVTKLVHFPIQPPSAVIKGTSSVFKRLGETEVKPITKPTTGNTPITIRTVTGLGSRIISDDSKQRILNTHSVLRPIKPTKAVKPVRSVSPVSSTNIMVTSADEASSPEKPKEKKSVFSRLGQAS